MSVEFRFEKKSSQSLREVAYESIREAIIKGNIKPGDRIREADISEQMGISRGPIREAFRQLEQEGLVFSHPYRETVVTEISNEEVDQVFVPIRRIVESYAAKRAHVNFTKQDFDYLHTIIVDMEKASSNDDLDLMSEQDLKFHQFLVQKAGGPGLLPIWNSIVGKIHSRFLYQGIKHESFYNVVKEHYSYLQLLHEGDPKKIDEHLDRHIT
ncbi:MAG: hypothetical protein APF76_18215 [Desulfitibacter sp. BRH_c19]|nr:MAG: hypothetical protein APF76_18215 [Desulfitibacter sp. BRH_c19]